MTETAVELDYIELETPDGKPSPYRIARLVLNRPKVANAFNGEVLDTMKAALKQVAQDKSVRALLVAARGKHFSAGADLGWMKESAQLSAKENRRESGRLITMFEKLASLKIPTIAVVQGAAYGGAVGMVAACDYAIATPTARFCLSEVRVGLIPAVILPYVSRKLPAGALRRLSLQGSVFDANEAQSLGLVQVVSGASDLNEILHVEVNRLLEASPNAQTALKKLQRRLDETSFSQGDFTADAIAAIRASDEGQAGLEAFFAKRPPPWLAKVPAATSLVVDALEDKGNLA